MLTSCKNFRIDAAVARVCDENSGSDRLDVARNPLREQPASVALATFTNNKS